jgi:hypothetical protein
MRKLFLVIAFSLSSFSVFAEETLCMKQAENAAIAEEKKENKKEKYQAKNTERTLDSKVLKAAGIKDDEEIFTTEVHNSKGAFSMYDVLVKKAGCKILSVKSASM